MGLARVAVAAFGDVLGRRRTMTGVTVGAADLALVLTPRRRNVRGLGSVTLGAVVITESGFRGSRLGGGGLGKSRRCGKQKPWNEEQQTSQLQIFHVSSLGRWHHPVQ